MTLSITLADLLLAFATLLAIVYSYFLYVYNYWGRKRVPYLEPKFPYGNSSGFMATNSSFGVETAAYYEEIKKRGWNFAGIWTVTRPVFVVVDPDYIRDILAKDFHHFIDRGFYYNENDDPISAHIFALDETRWKNIRIKLTPTFSSGKMKTVFKTMLDVSDYMVDAIDKIIDENMDVDIKEVLNCFTTDVIGSVAFGLECNSFKDPNAEFRQMGIKVFEIDSMWFFVKRIIISKFPKLALKLRLVGTRKDVSDFFFDVLDKNIKHRKENNYKRSDFLQLLIELQEETKDQDKPFTMEQLVAQSFLFFVAGYHTSSTTINFALYELSKSQQCQDKARKEISEVLERYEGQITYESLMEMTYLQQIIDEAQRIHTPVSNLARKCIKDYKLRDTDVTIEKGTPIVIPVNAIHLDPDYYPDPYKFDPERFSTKNKSSRHPYVHLPFGEGPRNCIGLRFGIMQTKIGLITILKQFRVKLSPKMEGKPLTFEPELLLLKSNETLYLTMEKLQ